MDDEKDRLAKEHNIEVIRIDCKESELNYIKQSIIVKLSNLFDLSNINWLKAEEFALSNLVKVVCEYKNNNVELSASEIAKRLNLCDSTVRQYLKKGNKLKWCLYDGKKEQSNALVNISKEKRKQVEIFKDGVSLGIFESAHYLDRQSEKLFGVKLDYRNICSVCTGKVRKHKGYTFKYVK